MCPNSRLARGTGMTPMGFLSHVQSLLKAARIFSTVLSQFGLMPICPSRKARFEHTGIELPTAAKRMLSDPIMRLMALSTLDASSCEAVLTSSWILLSKI